MYQAPISNPREARLAGISNRVHPTVSHLPPSAGRGPCIPDAPLWEQWRDIYATRTEAALVEESRSLRADEERLACASVPDRFALGMIEMRLALIEERLATD
jgi:hypothetical protein